MNSFGDDYVSFVPMHISFSPDGHSMLISTGKLKVYSPCFDLLVLTCTDQDKLILYSWNSGKQVFLAIIN